MSSPSFPHQAVQLNHFEWTIQPVMAPAHNQVGPCQRMAIKQKIPALMLPETEVPEEIPDFRAIRLRENRAVLTVLPMKGSPNEIPVHRNDEELNRNRLRQLVVLGEKML